MMVCIDIKDFPDLDNELEFVQELVREQVIKLKFPIILIIFKLINFSRCFACLENAFPSTTLFESF